MRFLKANIPFLLSKCNLLSHPFKKYKHKIGDPYCLIRIQISSDLYHSETKTPETICLKYKFLNLGDKY